MFTYKQKNSGFFLGSEKLKIREIEMVYIIDSIKNHFNKNQREIITSYFIF